MMTPTIGRIVLYRSPAAQGGRINPAIVTEVHLASVNLTVFPSLDCPQIRAFVPQGDSERAGECWYWPPRGRDPSGDPTGVDTDDDGSVEEPEGPA